MDAKKLERQNYRVQELEASCATCIYIDNMPYEADWQVCVFGGRNPYGAPYVDRNGLCDEYPKKG